MVIASGSGSSLFRLNLPFSDFPYFISLPPSVEIVGGEDRDLLSLYERWESYVFSLFSG